MNMAHVITDECVACGLCFEVCPAGAVVRGADRYSIAAEACTDCGLCVEVCPQECILAPDALVDRSSPDT